MTQLRQYEAEFEKDNVAVVIVTFERDIAAQNYAKQTGLHWPILVDRQRSLYAAYEFERGSWWALYSPASILRYLKLLFTGHRIGKPGEDWSQLGGNVVIDPDGIVRMHHASKTPHDRPSVNELFAVWQTPPNATVQ